MSLRVEFHDLVDVDLLDAWTWYEDREHGLGDRFLNVVKATVMSASRWPNAGTPTLRDHNDDVVERKVPTRRLLSGEVRWPQGSARSYPVGMTSRRFRVSARFGST